MDEDDEILRRVRELSSELGLFRVGRVTIAAVSGGPDSVCLLDVLTRLIDRPARDLVVVHVDHGLRPDSTDDASFVAELAAERGVRCEVWRVDVQAVAKERRLGAEHAGRVVRYERFAEVAARYRASSVATGHTRDDSVESMLMHLIRGSGADGLRGISPSESLTAVLHGTSPAARRSPRLVRPLLSLRRADTVAYCRRRKLAWRTDPTNSDPSFLRNRTRSHLLPVLRTYNPSIVSALVRTATLVRDDVDALERHTAGIARRVLSIEPGSVRIDGARWRRQHRAIKRRLLRRAFASLAEADDTTSFAAIERAINFLDDDAIGRLETLPGLVLSRSVGRIELKRRGTSDDVD